MVSNERGADRVRSGRKWQGARERGGGSAGGKWQLVNRDYFFKASKSRSMVVAQQKKNDFSMTGTVRA